MKKRLLLLTLSFIFSFQIFAQTVPEEQRTLLTKVSATWCPPCGGWGWTFFENLVEDNEDKAVLIVAHYSGQLYNTAADSIAENFNALSQPRFFVNNEDQSASPSNATSTRTAIETMVDDNFATTPVANAGIDILHGTNLEIQTKTKFFQAVEGEFYLGVYIVENEVIAPQESIGPNAVHEKILRTEVTENIYGELLVNGMVDANTEYDHTFTQEINSQWDVDHIEVVTIIWEKVDGKYNVVNTNIKDEFTIVNSNKNIELTSAKMTVQPNIISHQSTIIIDVNENLNNVKLEVFDLFGKKVTDLFHGNLSTGKHSFSLENSSNIGSGMYFINLQAGEKITTQKVIFK